MFNPIIERIFDYKNVISDHISRYLLIFKNFMSNFNLFFMLFLKRIKYQFDIRYDYYLLGKYLSKIDKNKFDLSQDKSFIGYIKEIKLNKELLKKTNKNLNSIIKKK